MLKKALRLILFGPPGCGKGLQCEMLVNKYGICAIGSGDLMRDQVKIGTPIGVQCRNFLDKGELVPDHLVISIVNSKIRDCENGGGMGWVLDGFPRTNAQAIALIESGVRPDFFFCLEIPDRVISGFITGRRLDPLTGKIYHIVNNPPPSEEIANRLIQRSDDTEETLRVRLEQYQANLRNVVDNFGSVVRRVEVKHDGTYEENVKGTSDAINRCISEKFKI